MKRYKILTLALLLVTLVNPANLAVPAYPYPVKVTQPDGTTLTVILKGDEFHHYHTTEDGYLITKGKAGIYNYATMDAEGKIADTRIKAHDQKTRNATERSFVKQLQENLPAQTVNRLMRAKKEVSSVSDKPAKIPSSYPRTGSPKSLVILVNFSDLSYVTPEPKTAFTNLLNQQGYSANGATGSARDYFRDNSMGRFNPEFDVVGPFTLPNPIKYYGENSGGSDKAAVQMVVDACKAADNAGVNFAQYDTDNDGIVDNVFVYYAGHNEAEHAPAETVWPHRWSIYPKELYGSGGNYSGTAASATFDGKRVLDYACTSELRGNSGTNMCGIGTFCHEFGHVLGLIDMYPTNGAAHFTLSKWSIYDSGVYLNGGKTPPALNAYERFQMGFLTPTILKDPYDATLKPLLTDNCAYLISPTDAHNLQGESPSPEEFFLLENRQNTGWDTYLPGHGMLVYRINFNRYDWDYNQPNNDPAKMGVELVCADKIASVNTLSGDPFPGAANVQSFTPKLRSGKELEAINAIAETNGVIVFKFKGGGKILEPPVATQADEITYKSFVAKWDPVADATGYYLTVTQADENGVMKPFITKKWITSTQDTVHNVVSERKYAYKVISSDKTNADTYERKSEVSNTIELQTLPYPFEKELRVSVNRVGNEVMVFVPEKNATIHVYNQLGQKIADVIPDKYSFINPDIVYLKNLPKGVVLLIQAGRYRTKVIL